MHYTVEFLPKFARESADFPVEHQNKMLDFVRMFQLHGLLDFPVYEGEIAPSWVSGTPEYHFARYKTSDVVPHFQWKNKGDHISLVDMYDHCISEGRVYLPSGTYFKYILMTVSGKSKSD